MPGVTAEISLSLKATESGSADLGTPRMAIDPIEELLQFSEGTDAVNKLNVLFSDTRTLAASANEDLDLSGALTDAFGATVTEAEVCAIFVKADGGNTNDVQVKAAAANGFQDPFLAAGDGVAIKAGEWQLFVSQKGWAVTAATGDLLNVANGGAGTGVTYSIVVLGRTVAA